MHVLNRYLNFRASVAPKVGTPDALLLALLQARRTPRVKKGQQAALEELVAHSKGPSLEERPLSKGAVLAYWGHTRFKVRKLKEWLRWRGVHLSKRITSETTHVLIGPKLLNLKALEGKTLLLDKDIQVFLDQAPPPLEDQHAIEQIKALLCSSDEANKVLAMQLLEHSGFIPELLPYVFVASRAQTAPPLPSLFHDYLTRYLHRRYLPLLDQFYTLSYPLDQMITSSIHQYSSLLHQKASTAPGAFSVLELARAVFAVFECGYEYLLAHDTDVATLEAIFDHFTQDQCLDLSDKNLPHLPPLIGTRTTLRRLDLSQNLVMDTLPDELLALQQLEYLNLFETGVMDVSLLERMPQLKSLEWLPETGVVYDIQLQHLHHLNTLCLGEDAALIHWESMQPVEGDKGRYVREQLPDTAVVWV